MYCVIMWIDIRDIVMLTNAVSDKNWEGMWQLSKKYPMERGMLFLLKHVRKHKVDHAIHLQPSANNSFSPRYKQLRDEHNPHHCCYHSPRCTRSSSSSPSSSCTPPAPSSAASAARSCARSGRGSSPRSRRRSLGRCSRPRCWRCCCSRTCWWWWGPWRSTPPPSASRSSCSGGAAAADWAGLSSSTQGYSGTTRQITRPSSESAYPPLYPWSCAHLHSAKLQRVQNIFSMNQQIQVNVPWAV